MSALKKEAAPATPMCLPLALTVEEEIQAAEGSRRLKIALGSHPKA